MHVEVALMNTLWVTAAYDVKIPGREEVLKAGESAEIAYGLACDLAASGAVNIPRPQPVSKVQPKTN